MADWLRGLDMVMGREPAMGATLTAALGGRTGRKLGAGANDWIEAPKLESMYEDMEGVCAVPDIQSVVVPDLENKSSS
jgi:hypothetical protein